MRPVSIALIAEYDPTFPPHVATAAAVAHAAEALGIHVSTTWLSTEHLDASVVDQHDGVWIAPGSPYKSLTNTLNVIRAARERGVPCLGTCGGFQHIVLEYARNVLGLESAHAEYDPEGSNLFITRLICSLFGRELLIQFVADSFTAQVYGATSAVEQYFCGFGVTPDRVDDLRRGPMQIVGSDAEGEVRVVEWPNHPFFVGTLFVPQLRSRPGAPHPLVSAFVKAACDMRE